MPYGVGCPGLHELGSSFVEVGSDVGLFDVVADGVGHCHLHDRRGRVGGF